MKKRKLRPTPNKTREGDLDQTHVDVQESRSQRSGSLSSDEILSRLQRETTQRAGKRKWGQILIALGIITVLDSCSFVPVPLIGPAAIWAGAALILVGAGLFFQGPRLKDTNEAIMVAMRYGNRLTVPRLALEMDISLKKAEKIIQQLVRSGVAEIDIDTSDPEDGIIYRVKGMT